MFIPEGSKSQIATIIIFMTAVIFLFALVTINMSRIAQKKTALNNVADGAALQLASQLGSMSNALKQELRIYGNEVDRCAWNWQLLLGGFLVVVGIAGMIFTAGQSGWLAGLGFTIATGAAITGGFFAAAGVTQVYLASNAGAQDELKLKMKSLSPYQQIIETPVYSVLLALSDDPAWVTDKFDLNRNGKTDDLLPRYLKWYTLRLNSLPRVRLLVENFYKGFFDNPTPDDPLTGRFSIKEDENMMVEKGKDSVRWQLDSDNDGTRDLKIVPWFRANLSSMLREMRGYGYGVNGKATDYTSEERIGDIDDSGVMPYEDVVRYLWSGEVEEFEDTIVRGLYNIDFDSTVSSLDVWLSVLKNATGEDWYKRLGTLKSVTQQLSSKLEERRGQIDACVSECKRRSWGCWADNCQGKPAPDCAWNDCCWTEPCGTEEEPEECCVGCYTQWMGCCGPEVGCGKLCVDANCKPEQMCSTPLGRSRWCCEITELEPYRGDVKGCYDNIVDVYPNDGTTRINSITVLNNFVSDIDKIMVLIDTLNTKVQEANAKSYDLMHEAFYVWEDKVSGAASEAQVLGHIAYVKSEGLNPAEGFKLPYPETSSEWRWNIFKGEFGNYTCAKVGAASGEFTIRIARFDEAPSSENSRIKQFWRFVTGKPQISAEEKAFVHDIALVNKAWIDRDMYNDLGQNEKTKLIDIINKYGLISTSKAHYGPGYSCEPGKSDPSCTPANKNKDIYIMETH